MKKLFLTMIIAMSMVFACCEYSNNSNQNIDIIDTIDTIDVIENDSVCDENIDTDTIHCKAITKNGIQCKNHRIEGDTLCVIHKNLKK